MLTQMGKKAKAAARVLSTAPARLKNAALLGMADALVRESASILQANQMDLEAGRAAGMTKSLLDRLSLSPGRIEGMADGLRQVAAFQDPIGKVDGGTIHPNGMQILKTRVPLGVVAGIVPFNFPAMIPWGWMVPLAIATGNTIVLKAASQTPLTSMRILELFYEEGGFPKGVVNLVTCSRHEAEIFLTDPRVKAVTFVGTTGVGKHIYSVASANGKRVQAQCEAKNHALVLEDADLESATNAIINSTYGCAGMRCMALPVIVVQESIADQFMAMLKEKAMKLKVGCAYDPETKLGPVVSAAHKKSVCDWIQKGIDEGAELVLDGRDIVVPGYENGFFVGPTILDHVKPGMSVGDREIFGPVTVIKRVKDFDEGLAIMNANPFANGSVIFTQSGFYARKFEFLTDGGMVGINVGIPVPTAYFPFSGNKDSFFGDLHVLGKDGVRFYTRAKTVTKHWYDETSRHKNVSTWEGTVERV